MQRVSKSVPRTVSRGITKVFASWSSTKRASLIPLMSSFYGCQVHEVRHMNHTTYDNTIV